MTTPQASLLAIREIPSHPLLSPVVNHKLHKQPPHIPGRPLASPPVPARPGVNGAKTGCESQVDDRGAPTGRPAQEWYGDAVASIEAALMTRRSAIVTARDAAVVPLLEDNACQVWWAHPTRRPSLDHLLHAAERDRRARFRRHDDQDRHTVGTALARLVLARHLDCPAEDARLRFDRTCRTCGAQHGKPQLLADAASLQFSIAHSGHRVVVAVTRGAPVGVDVEQLATIPQLEALAAEVLSPHERPAFQALPPADRAAGLLTYWTRKEALLKATGDGLAIPMATITVSGPTEPPALLRWPNTQKATPPAELRRLHPGPGYLAALAVLGPPGVQVQELDASQLLATARR